MTRVLVVEDEESYSDALAYMLRKEGFEVAIAADGNTALTEFDRNGADIVLLDLMLPGMSGTDVCKALRSRSAVPVIMVTARDSEIDKVVGLELGADDYVTKPYSARELIARVRAVLRRASPMDETGVIAVGDLRLDVQSRTLFVHGEQVALTPIGYGLLLFFLRSPERVHARDELRRAVWGDDVYVAPRTIDATSSVTGPGTVTFPRWYLGDHIIN